MQLIKTFYFEAAHKLLNYDGICKNLHGHSYRLDVVVEGDELTNGMLIDLDDFSDISKYTRILKKSHIVFVNDFEPAKKIYKNHEEFFKVVFMDINKMEHKKNYCQAIVNSDFMFEGFLNGTNKKEIEKKAGLIGLIPYGNLINKAFFR